MGFPVSKQRPPFPPSGSNKPPFVPDNLTDSVRQKLGQASDAFSRVLDNLHEGLMDKVTWDYVIGQLRYAKSRLERAETHAQAARVHAPDAIGRVDDDECPPTADLTPNVPAQDVTEGGAA